MAGKTSLLGEDNNNSRFTKKLCLCTLLTFKTYHLNQKLVNIWFPLDLFMVSYVCMLLCMLRRHSHVTVNCLINSVYLCMSITIQSVSVCTVVD